MMMLRWARPSIHEPLVAPVTTAVAQPLAPTHRGSLGISYLTLRVCPGDLDTSLHMNNGRYWTLMDLGRTDLMLRSGFWRAVVRNR